MQGIVSRIFSSQVIYILDNESTFFCVIQAVMQKLLTPLLYDIFLILRLIERKNRDEGNLILGRSLAWGY